MEIGRISAIPPVPRLRTSQSAPDVAGVYAAEFRKHDGQEADVADEDRAARGLENDDETDPAPDSAQDGSEHAETPADETPVKRTISFFA